MLTFYYKKIGFLAATLFVLSSLSCAEDVALPGEETGEWTNVISVKEWLDSDIRVMAEGTDGELYLGGRRSKSGDGTGQILFTDDAGISWDFRGKGMNPGKDIRDIVILEDGTVFAALGYGGVFRSMDKGKTWSQVNNRLPDLDVISIVIIPDGRLLVSTYKEGLFFSSDRGDTWVPCLSDSVLHDWMRLETDHGRHRVYASSSRRSNVFYSDDNCSTWQAMPDHGSYYISDLRVDVEGIQYLFRYSTLLKYLEDREEWVDITPESDDLYMSDFMIDAEGVLYVAHEDQNILWSGDGGSSWQVKQWTTPGMIPSRIFSHKGCIFLAVANYSAILFRSCDEGSTWQCAGLDDSPIWDLLIDQTGGMIARSGYRMFEKGEANGMWTFFWSFNGSGGYSNRYPNSVLTALCSDGDILFSGAGLTSVPREGGPEYVMIGEDTLVISIEVDRAGMIFLATNMGVMRSLDDGGPWDIVLPDQIKVLELEANIDSTVYLATENGLVMSEDYGSTWETHMDSTVVTAIASDSEGLIYAGVEGGIMFSADRGRSWEMILFEGYLETPRTLAMSPGGRVVALTSHRRLYLIEKGCVDHRVIFSEFPLDIRILIGEDGYLYYFEREIFRYSIQVDLL